ncbi:type II secretion system F family protein [Demequina sp. TTPB684]|uniref:type II secretion system F family protein n=1 Tax=unclassified Demequina TaxID=2620311 RepID=UPI001CF39486|nr:MULTISPECIES: type II secretion system F family protein [unclassified Demequina]MCB2413559.1 type II secretion system F family protein [Demequina sp. TTPB684]UPU87221.1 type II secretion system F family protein [Demequina sp. TMPB413]
MSPSTVLLGLALGVGLAMVAAWWRARTPRLADRVAPHLRASVADELRRRAEPITPFPTLERLIAPVVRDGSRWIERWGSPGQELEARLRRAGADLTVEQFRAHQVVWGVGGLALGAIAAVLLAASRGSSPVALVVLIAVAGVGGAAARDYVLSRAIAQREQRIVAELPTVAELLALSVAAGEGAVGALERVSRTTHGVMAEELRATLAASRTGTPLAHALTQLADRTGAVPLRRFADGVATAVERGTPLAEVLRAQAQDVRTAGQRALMEEGGKREIAMMVPVIFLILPVTVIFAVFPGLTTIRLGL